MIHHSFCISTVIRKFSLVPAIAFFLLAACDAPVARVVRQPDAPQASSASSSAQPMDIRSLTLSGATLTRGNAKAPLTLLVFTNHACAYCAEFQQSILPRLVRDFVETGKVNLRVAILPLHKYPLSETETAALFCASQKGKGWDMHDALFALSPRTLPALLVRAHALGIDRTWMEECLAAPEAQTYAQEQRQLAERLDVTLVPTLFLNDEQRVGLPTYADLRGWIQEKSNVH